MNGETVRSLLDQATYRFAKTMPWNPHFYTLKDTWEEPETYRDVIAWILENGELRKWGKKGTIRRYFDHGDWRYWPMTTNPDESILLNRALISKDKSVAVEEEY